MRSHDTAPVVFFAEPEVGRAGSGPAAGAARLPGHLLGSAEEPSTSIRGGASDARVIRQLLTRLPDIDAEVVEPVRVDDFTVRVTVDAADLGVVIASPLYVEYVSRPAGTPPTSPS